MRLSTSLSLASLTVTLVSAEHHGSKRNHAAVGISKREETESSMFKRDGGAQFTFYQDGLGACGKTNKPSDFIVALNSQQFDGGSHCFETISITIGGKTNQATIVDECMGCGFNNLDFSQGLFDFFGSEAAGILYGSWSFGSGDPQPSSSPSPSPTPKAKPSPTPSPKPSSKAEPSSTKAKPSTSSTSTSTKSSTTPTPSATSSSVAPNVDVQTAGAFASQEASSSNIYAINMAFMGISGLVANA